MIYNKKTEFSLQNPAYTMLIKNTLQILTKLFANIIDNLRIILFIEINKILHS